MAKYWLALLLLLCFGAYCLYATAFFAWVTATPASPAQLHRAQMLATNWSLALAASVAAILLIVARMIQLFLRRRRAQNGKATEQAVSVALWGLPMKTSEDQKVIEDWHSGQLSAGLRYLYNTPVRITKGKHAGFFAAVIAPISVGNDPKYLCELSTGEDIEISQSEIEEAT